MKSYLIAAILLITAFSSFGQSEPNISTYPVVRSWINPAQIQANSSDVQVMLLNRSQWATMDSKISTQIFSIENKFLRNNGIGLYVSNDQIGFERITSSSVHYSRQVNFSRFSISLGLGAGIANRRLDGSELRFQNPDPNAIQTDQQRSTPDFSMGAALHTGKFNVAASLKHIIYSRNSDEFFRVSRQFHAEAYYKFTLTPEITTEPSIIYKETGFIRKFGFGSLTTLYNRVMLGVNYTSGKETNFLLGIRINQYFQANYSYQHIFSNDIYTRPASHEVSLVFHYNKRRSRLMGSPRYL